MSSTRVTTNNTRLSTLRSKPNLFSVIYVVFVVVVDVYVVFDVVVVLDVNVMGTLNVDLMLLVLEVE